MKLGKWIYFVFLITVIGLGLFLYRTVFSYIFISLVFAYVLNPVVIFLENRGIMRVFAILIVYCGLGLLVAWGLNSLLPQIIKQSQSLLAVITSSNLGPDMQLERIPFIRDLKFSVVELQNRVPFLNLTGYFASTILALKDFFANFPQIIMKYSSSIFSAISFIVTVPIIGFFLLKDDHLFIRFILRLVPNRSFELTLILFKMVDEVAGKYLRAMMIEIVIIGSLSTIVLTAMGVNYAVLIGVLAGFTNIIPYFGPLLGALFGIVSVLITGKPLIYVLYVLIGMYGVQFIDNSFIYPVVVGKNTNMHPLIILLTVMAGGFVFGLVGMLVSVPVVYLVYSLVRILHQNLKAFEII